MTSVVLDADRFLSRMIRLQSNFVKQNETVWNSADCLLIHRAPLPDDTDGTESLLLKSAALHEWLFGYDVPDSILLLRKDGQCWFLGRKKQCEFLQPAAAAISKAVVTGLSTKSGKSKPSPLQALHFLVCSKDGDNATHYATLEQEASIDNGGKPKYIGTILKEHDFTLTTQGVVGSWEKKLAAVITLDSKKKKKKGTGAENIDNEKVGDDGGHVRLVDASMGIAFVMSIKDETELDLMKKSSVFANKVMKHGFVTKMEEVIDTDEIITHEVLANYVDNILEDPTRINLKVPREDVQSCFTPIVQSGGNYDLKVSAQSTSDNLSHDIIIVSIGARYRKYCSNIARTFFVDPPKKVSETYEILLEMEEKCLRAMKPGQPLREVYQAAVALLESRPGYEYLVNHLPKSLGFLTGVEFRESSFLITSKNQGCFRQGMVFCLALGFQNVNLKPTDLVGTPEKSPVKKLSSFSVMIADTVSITDGAAEVLTKMGKNLTDVAYNINDDEKGDEEDDDDEDEEDEAVLADAKMARRLANQSTTGNNGVRKSSRLEKDPSAQQEVAEGVAERERRQMALMKRRNDERIRQLASLNRSNGGDDHKDLADELETYKRTRDYPDLVQPNQVKVDMASQCVFLPIGGNPIPFHISTIKNVVMPEVDNATLLRINFYTAGIALGKDAPENMVKLVQKYAPFASFIRELTFRSLDGHNLTLAFRQISELRKRARQREIQKQEEADLVEQEKLVRTKNERVPRLADLTMRPVIAGRKTQGNLEAHTNGLRFISTRNEVVDVMYSNIKYAIFQPCESEIMVLIHFHLKNPIMIGKKKHMDVQFYTEVIEASQAVDNARRNMYDPDEMDDEQRERQLRRKLNHAFKDFCKKVDDVARRNNSENKLEFEVPYRDLGFTGNPQREMVQIMPTLNCLVSLTETPFFVVDLAEVEHVHFERVTFMSKAFDMVLINKDFSKPVWRVDMIPNGDKDAIQEWLTDMDLTYTEGPMNLNWKQIINVIKDDDRFYMDTEEDEVTRKEAGWEFLRLYGVNDDEDDDEDDEDSGYSSAKAESEEEEEEEESEAEDFDSESDDEDDFDADEDLEEQGMDWEEMEAEAAADDRRKRRSGDEEPEVRTTKKRTVNGPTSGSGRPGGNRRVAGGRR